jgi:dTDP-glucose 4,6-dehydratase
VISLLVTGAAGFIGANFVRGLLERGEDVFVAAYDKLTYAGNFENLRDLLERFGGKIVFVQGDICDGALVRETLATHRVQRIVHLAAESHVDRSIVSPSEFVRTNVLGTQVLLDAARDARIERFVHVSTDEVYGSLPEDRPDLRFTESSPLQPNSPYAASKAAADCLVRAAIHTHNLPAIITRCANNLGPRQFPEKLIPLFITSLIDGKKVPLYGDGMNVRDWIHVDDHCDALWLILTRGRVGEIYNIGADAELTNRRLTEMLLERMGKAWDDSVELVPDRPGHDRRYAIDASKLRRELGWAPRYRFEEALDQTIRWYRDNERWWRPLKRS